MIKLSSLYSSKFPAVIVYMLQSTEYDVSAYVSWLLRTRDFSKVMKRRTLDKTQVAKLLILFIIIGSTVQIITAVVFGFIAYNTANLALAVSSIALLLVTPIVWSYLVIIPTLAAKRLVINPRIAKQLAETKRILAAHSGLKIAVAGSYGKTTMKEVLVTVLSEGKNVAATPGNKNVAVAHYEFAKTLTGNEDILIIELGEGKPGDVEQFAHTIQPDIAVITGIAPAHLDHYAGVADAAKDIFSLANGMQPQDVYVNADSPDAKVFIKDEFTQFNSKGIGDWQVSKFDVTIHGSRFTLKHNDEEINVTTGLLGEHLVGVLSAAAIIAKQCGLELSQIEAGFAKTVPYQHRMQPYTLAGAWVIDDAYNGNLEGIKAGTTLLRSLKAQRKIYVTPGLVDQGEEAQSIHVKVGELIAAAHPDIVVLMKNSVDGAITKGLKIAGYKGELLIKDNPLAFYSNLDQFLAAGDVAMLQNDWTDNYQ